MESTNNSGSRSASPCLGRSPIRPESPLLRGGGTPPASPSTRRARELKRELKQVRSFKASLERSRDSSRSSSRCGTPVPTRDQSNSDRNLIGSKEMSFYIRPSLGGRKGWKIMPESGEEIEDPDLLQKVVDMIRDMEFSGIAVPERITLRV